ncbi:hypothetical protein TgHK011_001771 [Trichoderma gracile]|nr:hypothetical protein TgHK011_001771 [Trichoderma gracile]
MHAHADAYADKQLQDALRCVCSAAAIRRLVYEGIPRRTGKHSVKQTPDEVAFVYTANKQSTGMDVCPCTNTWALEIGC